MKQILWFRRDLRVKDNALLSIEGEVLPIFIFDKNILESLEKDDRRLSFIWFYIQKLKNDLKDMGLDLKILYGDPVDIFKEFKSKGFDRVYASGDYDAYAISRDEKINQIIEFEKLNDTYIFAPNEVLKDDGTPYLVFTPFYKKVKSIYTPSFHLNYEKAKQIQIEIELDTIDSLDQIGFKEVKFDIVDPYEKLEIFKDKIDEYKEKRDYLDVDFTSHLSVDLRFGTISIREVVRYLLECKKEGFDTEPFFRQLIFREFYAYLLFHFPSLQKENYRYKIDYKNDKDEFTRFCKANTGVPIVDAGISELFQTGDMHNRVRMIVASFLTKNLQIFWWWGEQFFAKHLLDYDASANILSWQWSGGTGIDPQPYFRIFNPYTQAKKFDKDAKYIKKWLPLLKEIDPKYLYNEEWLFKNDINGYPKPMVHQKDVKDAFLSRVHK